MDTPPKNNTQENETPTSKSRLKVSSSSDPTNVMEPREDKSTSNEQVENDASLGKEASTEMELPHCSGTNPDTLVASELLNCKSLNESEVYRRLMMKTPSTSETSVGSNNVPKSSDYEVNSGAMNHSPRIGLHRNGFAMSSKKKRVKLDSGEGESCKRCNCKKSKCLKLYCDCFSAEVYCTGRCSCVDCFNRPIHKDTILATCKQIESRNPGAFAPKVIRGSETRNDSSKAQARVHLNSGCNCKKTNCLPKLCGCYKDGLGCCKYCRCKGCQNKFGRKDG